MSAASSKSRTMGLSIVIGIAIGTLAAILSTHFAIWLVAGIFVGIAAGASFGRKTCPECEARELRGSRYEPDQNMTVPQVRVRSLDANLGIPYNWDRDR